MYQSRLTGWARHWDFILFDYFCLCFAFLITHVWGHNMGISLWEQSFSEVFFVAVILNFCIMIFFETLEGVIKRGYWLELAATVKHAAIMLVGIILFLFTFSSHTDELRKAVYLTIGIYAVLTYCVRVFWRKMIIRFSKRKAGKALLIVTTERFAPALVAELKRNNYGRHIFVGLALSNEENVGKKIQNVPIVTTKDKLVEYITQNWVDEVFISEPLNEFQPNHLIEKLNGMGVTVHVNVDLINPASGAKHMTGNVGGHCVITSTMNYMTPWQSIVKRSMDIVGGLLGCIVTGFIYLIIAPKIKKESPGPVFFSQTRIGRNGKPFKFYKFRSMCLNAEEQRDELKEQNRIKDNLMFKVEFDPRIIGNHIDENGNQVTGIGEFIRRTSIDEFPQFYNVLRGEMSLVGTRPPLPDEYESYSACHKARLSIKPGITGLWQVNGRSNVLDFDEVVRMDTWYINNWSVGLDLKLLLKTVKVVLKQDGSM